MESCSITSKCGLCDNTFIPPTEVCPAGSRLRNLPSTSYLSLACRQVCCSSLLCKADLVSRHLETVSTQALSPKVPTPHTPREGIQILHSILQNACDPHVFKPLFGEPSLLFRCKFILFHLYLRFSPCGSVRCQMEIAGSLFEGGLIWLFSSCVYSINIYWV